MWPHLKTFRACLLFLIAFLLFVWTHDVERWVGGYSLKTMRDLKSGRATTTIHVYSLWVQQYALWHQKTRASLNPDNWEQYKFMILHCPPTGGCAGTADRLEPVVWCLRLAQQTKRLLFIHWEHPYPLEEYLIPAGIIDWSMPDWLVNATLSKRLPIFQGGNITENDKHNILGIRMKLGHEGTIKAYDAIEGKGAFAKVYSEAFHLLFQPSPPISKMLQQRMHSGGLKKAHVCCGP